MQDIPRKQNKKGVSKKQTNQTKGKGVPKTKKIIGTSKHISLMSLRIYAQNLCLFTSKR